MLGELCSPPLVLMPVIDDAFKLTVDVLFPPPTELTKTSAEIGVSSKEQSAGSTDDSSATERIAAEQREQERKGYPLEDYEDNENLW